MQTTMVTALTPGAIDDLYPRYSAAWDLLLENASARHVLTREEFEEEMRDPRIEKYVIVDDDDRVVAMTTLTTDLTTIPWINPVYYHHRFPKEAADGNLFYLGYTFVDHDHRHEGALTKMAEALNERLSTARGVIGFDISGFGMAHGIGRRLEQVIWAEGEISQSDTQTYFVVDYRRARNAPAAPDFTVTSFAEHPVLIEDVQALLASQWPAYTLGSGAAHGVDLQSLLVSLPDHQVLLLDGTGALAGVALSVPLAWDGSTASLPAGWDAAIVAAHTQVASGQPGDTLCLLSITVAPDRANRGLAALLIAGVQERAAALHAHSVITPLRPTRKSQYPLIPMTDYLTWHRPDGEAFDPWLRQHLRCGAEMLGLAPESMVISGTVAEWESWLGTGFPGSGDYVITGGLVPLRVDHTANCGTYIEPNVWVRYPISR